MAEATAKVVAEQLPAEPDMGVVFVAGDNAYGQGTAKQYAECYDPTWGRFKDRTRPVPGIMNTSETNGRAAHGLGRIILERELVSDSKGIIAIS